MENNSSFLLDQRLNVDEALDNLTSTPFYGSFNVTTPHYTNQLEDDLLIEDVINRDPFYVIIPITLIYAIILISGFIGNISTCIVISRNKAMHTATNYYLFSLAVSDFMLLISGAPMELYHIWYKHEFIFGEAFCILRNAINEMSANATVLTITAFTIERYVAICHPFLSHTMSKLSRAIKFIFLIWIVSIAFATPQAIQTGIVINDFNQTWCTIVQERVLIQHSFELATIFFFFAPMTLISVLYMLIGMKLRSSTLIKRENGNVVRNNNNLHCTSTQSNTSQSTKRVLKMLVAVVICFFLCWFPFHLQRLVYIYASYSGNYNSEIIISFFTYTTYISGILYYLSTCINPILYNLMSNKFRQAFKETLQKKCCSCSASEADLQKRQYRMLSRSKRWNVQSDPSEYSGSGKDDYYSSSTQKQSIDTIAASRNASQMSKYYSENFNKSPSIIEMGSVVVSSTTLSASRFANNMNNENSLTKSCNACLSTKVVGSEEINVFPHCLINEIQLNIFPPSVAYTKPQPTSTLPSGGTNQQKNYYNNVDNSTLSGNCLNIDVHENNKLHDGACNENREKSVGNFSHISFKRSDSILHISIGNSSKIIKRNKLKRRRWFFTKLYKLSRKSKRDKMCLSPQCCCAQNKCDSYHLNNTQSLSIVNDNLVITINKKSNAANSVTIDSNNDSHVNSFRILDGDLAYGANELDFYMNEIKKRENRVRYDSSK
ncbi:hypothetical protein PVAND_000787 [Polypedilum vanderplanki]|uniref:G-protein coupled receptors family 1 profile domain-containing protein n=1 Tax=Polypedilum vanderplanki TaxID=319348 RepID=A0A9J6BKX2_POLVA|nr:hypothetical protein PVAND_000787 [Polypedilum vanderplanki]